MTPTATQARQHVTSRVIGRVTGRVRVAVTDQRGVASTVTVMVMFPLTAVLLLAGVQTVLWQHARTTAADMANQTATLVATGDLNPADADTQLTARLDAHPDMTNIDVTITTTAGLVTVTVAGDAHGILIGTRTRTRIHTTTATPTEQWQPLP
jgi:hypothetical protein